MDLFQIIETYLSLNFQPGTIRGYWTSIRMWCEFLGHTELTPAAARAVCRAQAHDAELFVAYLRTREGCRARSPRIASTLSDASVATRLVGIRSVYGYLVRRGLCPKDPFALAEFKLRPEANLKRPTQAIPYGKVVRILQCALRREKGVRDAAFFALWFGGAMRRNEPLHLTIADFRDNADGSMVVWLRCTKSGRDTEQIVGEFFAEYVRQYRDERVCQGALPSDFLFSERDGRPCSTHTFYHRWDEAVRRAGLDPKHYSPHSARATSITKLLDDGVPHREVQEFSRHRSVQTVEKYDKKIRGGMVGRNLNFVVDRPLKLVQK